MISYCSFFARSRLLFQLPPVLSLMPDAGKTLFSIKYVV